jgi:tetraacyldisaccharide-1-P 4'-kinase
MAALQRADLVVVTRKSVPAEVAERVAERLQHMVPDVPIAIATLRIDRLVQVGRDERDVPPATVFGATVLAVAGIGDPGSFISQLEALGARVTTRVFADHHPYTVNDVAQIVSAAANHKYVVTTEKDVVKLGVLWPANGPTLLYVSQAVEISDNESAVARAIDNIPFHPSPQTARNGHRPTPSNR